MTYLSQGPIYRRRHYAPACAALCLSSLVSILTINLPMGNVSLILLPLLIVSLWPRGVNSIVSIATIFFVGIWMDWITNGALGQWALVYLSVYVVLRPDRREAPIRFGGAILHWGVGLVSGGIMLLFTGWVAYGAWPDFTALLQQTLLVSALLPLIVIIRNITRYLITDPDDRDFE